MNTIHFICLQSYLQVFGIRFPAEWIKIPNLVHCVLLAVSKEQGWLNCEL